ncbi:MAG: 50S ribosomal protein L24 [Clostridiales bacterium]|nr:50S ribosomal protein L24 [Clostridiales bacterium]
MNTLSVKKGDTIVVLSGKDKGKQGKVLTALPKNGMVVAEGVNIVTRHKKPRKQGEPGGIIKHEGAIRASKVMRVCPKCHKPTRIAHRIMADGGKVRRCKKCGEDI